MNLKSTLLVILAGMGLVLASPAAGAAGEPSPCPQFFLGGQSPRIGNPKLAAGVVQLCYGGFSVLYSPVSLGPLASADHLERAHVQAGHGVGRHGTFHAEAALPKNARLSPSDFRNPPGAWFDKGHMVPNGDMWTASLQAETFTLANIVPQDADNNEVLWEGIEVATRDLAERDGELYVVTGPIFQGAQLQRLNGKALVPTQLFKAIYDPARNQAGVYVARNAPGMAYSVLSVAQLQELTGIDVFPALPDAVKQVAMQLPAPTPTIHQSRETRAGVVPEAAGSSGGESTGTSASHVAKEAMWRGGVGVLLHHLLRRH